MTSSLWKTDLVKFGFCFNHIGKNSNLETSRITMLISAMCRANIVETFSDKGTRQDKVYNDVLLLYNITSFIFNPQMPTSRQFYLVSAVNCIHVTVR